MSCCIHLNWVTPTDAGDFQLFPAGQYNNANYYQFDVAGVTYYLYFNDLGAGTGQWIISTTLGTTTPPFQWGTKVVGFSECPPLGVPNDRDWETSN